MVRINNNGKHQHDNLFDATLPAIEKPHGRYLLNGIGYASRSERACAALLEKYVVGWKPLARITVQIPIGLGDKHCDFKIDNLFIEYHPICLRWSFHSDEAFNDFEKALRRLPRETKKAIRLAIKKECAAAYDSERWWALKRSPTYNDHHLICVHSPTEFCKAIIKPLTRQKVSVKTLVAEFNRVLRAR